MKKATHTNLNKKFNFVMESDGSLYCFYDGEKYQIHDHSNGIPLICQARNDKLLFGSYGINENRPLRPDDVLFVINGINHSYNDWTGNIFKDYDIKILQGKKADVRKFFEMDSESKGFWGCNECCGCGDW